MLKTRKIDKEIIKILLTVIVLFIFFIILFSSKNNEEEICSNDYGENSIDNKLEEKEQIKKENLLQKEEEAETGIIIDTFLFNIKELNHLAIEFKEQNKCKDTVTQLCLQYIRKDKYNNTSWNLAAGSINTQFIDFVEQNNKQLFNYKFQNSKIQDSNVDFVHMCAALNAILYEQSLLPSEYSGWAGDLVTLMGQVIKYDKNAKKGKDELVSYAESLIGANNSNTMFGKQDLIADIDAVNLSKMDTQSFYTLIIEYYYKENDIRKNRGEEFKTYICDQEQTTTIYEVVLKNFNRNYISMSVLLENTYNTNVAKQYRENSEKYIEIMAKAFDNYFSKKTVQ